MVAQKLKIMTLPFIGVSPFILDRKGMILGRCNQAESNIKSLELFISFYFEHEQSLSSLLS